MTTPQPNNTASDRWPVWKITLVVYLPVFGATAVNIFFLSLMLQRLGFVAFTPVFSIIAGAIAGIPLAWLGGAWFYRMISEAETPE